MNGHLKSHQMEAWIDKLQMNMARFLENPHPDQEEKLAFVRHQYVLLDTTLKVLDGKAQFLGCAHPQKQLHSESSTITSTM